MQCRKGPYRADMLGPVSFRTLATMDNDILARRVRLGGM